MKNENTLIDAFDYLNSLERIDKMEDHVRYKDEVFLLPDFIDFNIVTNSLIETYGMPDGKDKKTRDLIRIIEVVDELNIIYNNTNVLTPLVYAESLDDIPWHLNTQGVIFTKVDNSDIMTIERMNNEYTYGKHQYDKLWLPFCSPINDLKSGEIVCVCNRRVGGWDGSESKPVIELLGAGGHLPLVWDDQNKDFKMLSVKENFEKETREELGVILSDDDIRIFGGYKNEVTHELVVLGGIFIDPKYIPVIQKHAYSHVDPNTMGIYMGRFHEVIEYYLINPIPFAGGAKTVPTNFPSQKELMDRVLSYIQEMKERK